jgi:hypothetical protein
MRSLAWLQTLIDVETDPMKLHVLQTKMEEDRVALCALMPECEAMRQGAIEAQKEIILEERREKILNKEF